MATKSRLVGLIAAIALGVFTLSLTIYAQQPAADKKPLKAKPDNKSKAKPESDPLELQRRTVAISLLTSLADEARSYQDQTLRARVQARGVEQFDVEGIFRSLAKEDLYRSIEMARGFTADTPRAIATLAVARAVLETKKESASRTEALEIRN